jgi:DNA invertase Pin-like site-specific DNA recombinase
MATSNATSRRLVAYLRVSTDRQAEEGLGLEVQEQAIRRWAKTNGYKIVAWATDAGVSGSNGLETREALPGALGAIRAGEAAGMVVYRLDRLARDLIVQETVLAEIRRMGGAVFSTFASEDAYLEDDPADPSRKLIRQILGAVSEYERAMTRLRLEAGRSRKREKGGYAGHGSPAFGYRAESRTLVAEDDEQETVARIVTLAEEGRSLREIVATLEAEGRQPKRGARWYPQTVARVLARTHQ